MRFKYRGVSGTGERVEAEQEAVSREELILELKRNGVILFDVQELGGTLSKSGFGKGFWNSFVRINPKTVAFFTRQLSELMESGIPLVQCIDSVRDLSSSKAFTKVLDEVAAALRRGCSLYEALAQHPDVFSDIYLSTIQVGETSGNLQLMLTRLADFLENDQELRGKVRSAMSYPMFILAFSLLLTYGMVSWLLPGFEPVWAGAGLDLNRYPVTLLLIRLGRLTHSFWDELLLLAILGFLGYGFRVMVRDPRGARATDRFVYNMPIFGKFVQLALMTRVAQSLATLVESGVPLVKAIELSGRTAGNRIVSSAMDDVGRKVLEGKGLGQAVEESPVFPRLMVQMIGLGSKSGSLAKMLNRVAHYYRGELNSAITAFTALVEPLMMLMVGAIVFTFVIGVFVPIMGVVSALQNQM